MISLTESSARSVEALAVQLLALQLLQVTLDGCGTLALALYTATQTPSGDLAAFRLTVIAVIVAFAALIASELLARRLRTRLGEGHA